MLTFSLIPTTCEWYLWPLQKLCEVFFQCLLNTCLNTVCDFILSFPFFLNRYNCNMLTKNQNGNPWEDEWFLFFPRTRSELLLLLFRLNFFLLMRLPLKVQRIISLFYSFCFMSVQRWGLEHHWQSEVFIRFNCCNISCRPRSGFSFAGFNSVAIITIPKKFQLHSVLLSSSF